MLDVDQEFTRIRRELTKEGRFNNTLFLLTTDNGMTYGAHRVGTKYVPYSTQMPLFAYWADGRGVSPAEADAYLSNVDIAPTLCQLGGCRMGPYPNGQRGPDGRSFLGLITAQSSSVPTRDALYEENRGNNDSWPPWRALRTTPSNPVGEWHYIENDISTAPTRPVDPNRIELYDTTGGDCWNWTVGMPGDPCELTNLARDPTYGSTVKLLHAQLRTYVTNVDPRIP
jgi:arylsulfatase A-like enzyme